VIDGLGRVLQLGKGWYPEEPGGLNRFYHDLLQQLSRSGVAATGLVTGSPEVGLSSRGMAEAVCPASLSMARRWWRWRSRVRELVARDRFGLVASHFALYTWPAMSSLRRIPMVVHFHGPWALEGRAEGCGWTSTGARFAVERRVYGAAAGFIVLSRAFGQLLAHRYRVPEKLIRVIPGGVDTARFRIGSTRSEARERLRLPADRPVVLSVRRLVRRMGLENLLSAAAAVRKRIPDVLFVVVGKGPLAPDLDAMVRARGLEDHVRLTGFLPDDQLPLAYRAADLSVVPSIALEGFGLVAVESLAAGTPVVATPVGGLPEVLEGVSPQLVLPDAGGDAIARGVAGVLTGTLRVPDADTCRQFAQRHYDWTVVTPEVLRAYCEVGG
jgi:glycosyltransferase involved in cell wall biosynthesis